MSSVPSTLVRPFPPARFPRSITRPSSPRAALPCFVLTPLCAIYSTGSATGTELTGRRRRDGQDAPADTWFSSQKGQVPGSKKLQVSTSNTQWGRPKRVKGEVRVVMATGAGPAASEQLLAGTLKCTLLPRYSVSGLRVP